MTVLMRKERRPALPAEQLAVCPVELVFRASFVCNTFCSDIFPGNLCWILFFATSDSLPILLCLLREESFAA